MTQFSTAGSELVTARAVNASHFELLQSLELDAFARKVPNLPVRESVTSARISLTIEGASTLDRRHLRPGLGVRSLGGPGP